MWVYGESLHGLIGGIRMFVPAMLSIDGIANYGSVFALLFAVYIICALCL